MFRPVMLIAVTACTLPLAPSAAYAHHSRGPYDLTKETVFEGTVVRLDWRNPHIMLTVETRDSDGRPRLQEIEVWAVSQARAMGLPREVMTPGAHVAVRANPGRRGPTARALGLDLRTEDGAVYPLNTDAGFAIAPSVSVEAQGVAGRWVPTLESFNDFQRARRSWSFTEDGRAAEAERGRRLMETGAALLGICEPIPPPPLSFVPDLRTIEVRDDAVVIRFEAQGLNLERIVHLHQEEHPSTLQPSTMGHSIGHWEGDSLVIDTVGIAPHPLGWSARARVIERLTLTPDRRHLEYALTVEDPLYLREPGSYTATWDHRPDLEPSSEPCDSESARRAIEE
jgi:hypothetical protein